MSALAEPREKKARIWERDPHDWYVEPPAATEALLQVERFLGGVWDPACGQGNIVTACHRAGLEAWGTDLVQRVPFDYGGRWFLETHDFLEANSPPYGAPNIVCNPPFGRAKTAEAFIRKALTVASGKVAMFLDIRFLAGAERANGLFAELPPHRIWVMTPRVSCPPGTYLQAGGKPQNGSSDWCWAVWDCTAPPATTTFGWLRRAAA